MNVLVTVASKHGSTLEIANAIARELQTHGVAADVRDIGEPISLDRYDAAIIGSAVYMGNWMPEARRFIDRNSERLESVPVWLFSSGPLGDDPMPKSDPNHRDDLLQAVRVRDHRIFVGKLDRSQLGLGERLITKMVKAPEGDFRDWDAIRSWAREIAVTLPAPAVVET